MTSINGTEYVYLNQAVWQSAPAGEYLSGSQTIKTQRILTLRGEVVPTTTFDALTALEGQNVSVTTCGYDVNSDVTYYNCVIDNVTGIHDGPYMTNVSVSVKVSEI
jgi:hypothetical protein